MIKISPILFTLLGSLIHAETKSSPKASPQTPVPSASGAPEPNRIQLLNGPWTLACDPANEGKRLNWQGKPPGRDVCPAIVPGTIQQSFPGYHGVAWYWTAFRAPAKPASGTFHSIRFREADYFAEVWLNGVLLGSHEGAEFPFDFRCDEALRYGAENLLAVRVINPVEEPIDGFTLEDIAHRFKFNKNYGPGMMANFGGLTQEVVLDMGRSRTLKAFTLLPRQREVSDGTADRAGTPNEYEFYLSADGEHWTLAAKGTLAEPLDMQIIALEKPESGPFLRFLATRVVDHVGFVDVARIGANEKS